MQRHCFRCINRPQRLLSKTRQRLSYGQTCQWCGGIVFQDVLVLFLDPAGEEYLLAVEIPKSVILETETASAMASLLAPPKPWAMKMAIDLKIWRDTCRPRFVAVGFRRDASVDSRLTY